jgi:hypothetical protein
MSYRALCRLVIVTAILGLLGSLPQSQASLVTQTLTQTPVTGRLAAGGAFEGQLTIHTVALDEEGDLIATGSLSGTVAPASGVAVALPLSPFTTLAALLDLRGDCLTVVVDFAPFLLPTLEQEITLVPVVLSLRDAPEEEHLLHSTLCTLAHPQE